MGWKRKLAGVPILGRVIVFGHRLRMPFRYYRPTIKHGVRWLFKSKEFTNFTYDLEPTNREYLACMIAVVTGRSPEDIRGYFAELENDTALFEHIRQATKASDDEFISDADAKFGRRIGWYAFVRALKPKVVVETGIHKGLGSVVLTSALQRNAAEGAPGYYYGTEIRTEYGFLLCGPYAQYGKILYGDSIESLKALGKPIDLFINDSDHSEEYEGREYQTVKDMLPERAVLLGHNSDCTDKLYKFAVQTGRKFLFFHEVPREHWYPGGGIGIAYR